MIQDHQDDESPRPKRIYSTSRPSICGCCRSPIHVVETVHTTTLLETTCGGDQLVHQCPESLVQRWQLVRRLVTKARGEG
jgi:hypothetical protein